MTDRIESLKEKLHFVRLATFNARLLGAIQTKAQTEVDGVFYKIIERVSVDQQDLGDGHIPLHPNLSNQSVPLSMGYLTFVWLREAIRSETDWKDAVDDHKALKLLPKDCRVVGERRVVTANQHLRVIRNGLGHGRVYIQAREGNASGYDFVFKDIDDKKEKELTSVLISWEDFEKWQDIYYRAIYALVYA